MPPGVQQTRLDHGSQADRLAAWAGPLLGFVAVAPFTCLLVPDGRVLPESVYSDYQSFQLPIREFARSEWQAGRFPHWNPHLLAGWPQHAGQQAALCHPVLTPLVLLLGANYGIKLAVFMHLVCAYVGQYLLARHWNVSRWACGYAGLVYVQSSYLIDHLMTGHVNLVMGYAAVPWFLLCCLRLLRDPRASTAAQMALVTACLLLVGHPQILVYALCMGCLWCGMLQRGNACWRRMSRSLFWMSVALTLAGLLSGAQLLPSLELLADGWSDSERRSPDFADQMSLDGVDIMRLWMPSLRGAVLRGIPEWSPLDFAHERSAYLGQTTLWLTCVVCLSAGVRRWQIASCGAALVCLSYGLGSQSVVFATLTWLVPPLQWFRCPGRVLCIYCCLLPLVAASGLDMLSRSAIRGVLVPRRWQVLAVLFLGNTLLPALFDSVRGMCWEPYQVFTRWYLVWEWVRTLGVTWICLVLIGGRVVGWYGPGGGWPAWVILITACDLGSSNVQAIALDERTMVGLSSAWDDGELHRFLPAADYPNMTANELRYAHTARLAHLCGWSTVATNEGGVLPRRGAQLLQALRVHPQVVSCLAACDLVVHSRTRRVQRQHSALPRIRFLSWDTRSLWHVPLREVTPQELDRLRWPVAGAGLELVDATPQQWHVRLQSGSPGLLMLAECGGPGWQVAVDGRPATPVDVHGVFQGVMVDSGTHQVVFRYVPRWYRPGLCASGVGAVVLCLLAWPWPGRVRAGR